MKKIFSCLLASTLALQLVPNSRASEPVQGASDWAVPYISTAISHNLIPENLQSGYTAPITRAEFCALAVAVYEVKLGSEISERVMFTDTSDLNVEKAAGIGAVSGKSDGIFDPDAEITRQEAAVILTQLASATGNTLPEAVPFFLTIQISHCGQVKVWEKFKKVELWLV